MDGCVAVWLMCTYDSWYDSWYHVPFLVQKRLPQKKTGYFPILNGYSSGYLPYPGLLGARFYNGDAGTVHVYGTLCICFVRSVSCGLVRAVTVKRHWHKVRFLSIYT